MPPNLNQFPAAPGVQAPPANRFGRGRSASGLAEPTALAIADLENQISNDQWELAIKFGTPVFDSDEVDMSTPGTFTLYGYPVDALVTVEALPGEGSFQLWQSDTGINFDIEPSSGCAIKVKISDVIPDYSLGDRLRLVLEFDPLNIPDMSALGNESGVGVGYVTESLQDVLWGSLNMVDGDLARVFLGFSPEQGPPPNGIFVDNDDIGSVDQVLALEFGFPGGQAGYCHAPADSDLNWDRDVTLFGAIYAIEGNALLPSGEGTLCDASLDNFLVYLSNAAGPVPNLQGRIKNVYLYKLKTR